MDVDGGIAYQVWEMNNLMSPPPLLFVATTPETVGDLSIRDGQRQVGRDDRLPRTR